MLGAGETFADDLALEGTALFQGEVLVVLRQTGLALLVHQQHEPDPHPHLDPPPTAGGEDDATAAGRWFG